MFPFMKTKSMKPKPYLFILISMFTLGISAQTTPAKMPQSIYAISHMLTDQNQYSDINKRLKLTGYQFVYVDLLDLDLNQFSIDNRSLGNKPTKWINDDYLKYRDENLLKGFRLKYDPTRWNLQCGNPRSVYIE